MGEGRRVEQVRPTGEVVIGGLPVDPADVEGLHILHADLDAFYASVEVLKDPSLRGKPLLVGGTGSRGVVTSASYQARAYGCRNAMPMAQARRLCPQAVAVPPDFATYRRCSKRVLQVFQSVTPLLEPLALDEAFLDVRGARRLLGTAMEIARTLRARVREETGLALTVGVAGNKFLAKLASTRGKPEGLLVVPPSRALAFLHPLPAQALWGVGPAAVATLARYGLRTVGEVARSPSSPRAATSARWCRSRRRSRWALRRPSPATSQTLSSSRARCCAARCGWAGACVTPAWRAAR
jgi:DNA polymerase-4